MSLAGFVARKYWTSGIAIGTIDPAPKKRHRKFPAV